MTTEGLSGAGRGGRRVPGDASGEIVGPLAITGVAGIARTTSGCSLRLTRFVNPWEVEAR